jgi:hypothetical protein
VRQEEGRESVIEEELCVTRHADAIVGQAVEENHGVAVAVVRMDRPGAERGTVGCVDGDAFEVGIELVRDLAHGGFFFRGKRAADRMQNSVGYEDSGYQGECEIKGEE